MADRSVAVNLKASVSDYLAGMRQAKAATSDFASNATKSATQHKAQWSQVGQSVSIAGLAIAAGVGFAVSRFADFDAAMSAAGAATRATSGDLAQLREAALQAGQDTQFSATEAAQGITELAKAGVSTADILNGGLAGALDLAAAGQLDVAKAAELAATAMTQFKLSGDKLPHVADLLAAGAGKAQGSVEDMGMALKQSGLVAQQYGLSVEETTGALAAFASAGLVGSDAGTSFKAMLQRLTPQSAEAAKEMDRLGISAFDAQGEFIGLEAFAGNLQTALSGLTTEQRNAAMATIFGSDAVRAAAVLYDQGAAGVQKWISNVNDAGFAQEQAARLTDNWRGDLERLTGALDTAFIKGGSGANDALRGLTQGLESVVNGFNNLSPAAQSSVTYLAAAAAGIALVGGGALIAVPKVLAFKAAVEQLGLTSGRTGTALRVMAAAGAVVAAAGIGSSLADMGSAALVATPDTERLANGLRELAAGAQESRDFGSLFARGMGLFRNDAEQTSAALEEFGTSAKKALDPSLVGSLERLTGAGGRFAEQAKQIDAALAQLASGGSVDEAKAAFDRIAQAAQAQGVPIDKLREAFPQYAAALDSASAASAGASDGINTAKVALDSVAQAAESAKQTTDAYVKSLQGINNPALAAREAARGWEEAILSADAAVRANADSIRKHGAGSQESAAATRAADAALDGMAKAAMENLAAMAANGATQGQLQSTLAASRQRLEEVATRFFGSRDAARQYVDQVLRVPPTVNTNVTTTGMQQAYSDILTYARSLSNIPREINTIVRTTQIAQRMDAAAPPMATGGLFRGIGTTTSDSNLVALSDREYVVKATAVEKYGVAFMDRVNAMRFADGGLVGRAAVGASSASGSSLAGLSVTGTLDTPWGPASIRGIVRDEVGRAADMAAAGRRTV